MWTGIGIALYILIAISIVVSLLLNGIRPSKTLAWLLAIFTIPVGGILLYLMVGRNRRKQKVYTRHTRLPEPPHSGSQPSVPPLSQRMGQIRTLIEKHSGFPLSTDNELELLKDGENTFKRIFEALQAAEESIHVQYYIFEEGELADRLLELFVRKEAAGVEVRLIYDSIGSLSLSRGYLKRLRNAGIEVHNFLPYRFGKFLTSLNYRNHRKIIVVDGKIAFTGGINISDKYLKGDRHLGMWHDMHLMVRGHAAHQLDAVFINDWELVSGKRLEIKAPAYKTPPGSNRVQILATGPDDDFPLMEQLYFSLINSARSRIYITNPYIIPSHAIMTALHTAALSGVDVRLMVSAQADSAVVTWCVRSYFQRFLRAGIRIFLYPEGFLHSKIITVDDAMCTIGTANVDDRSFQHNYEVNAVIYQSGTARELRNYFEADSKKSIELEYDTFRQRPWRYRLAEGAARTVSPLL
ncbi:MAG: cardiolipin synthase [Robiginitalea sp.]